MVVILEPIITDDNILPLEPYTGFDKVCFKGEWYGKVWAMLNNNVDINPSGLDQVCNLKTCFPSTDMSCLTSFV